MKASYTKIQRDAARQRKEALVTISVNLRNCDPPGGIAEFYGPMPRDLAERVREFAESIQLERMRRLREQIDRKGQAES